LLSNFLGVSPQSLLAQPAATAARNGELAWYTLIAVEDSQRIAQAFEKRHPGISVKVFRNRETALLPRIINEKQAGRPIVDVVSLRAIGYHQIHKRNLYASSPVLETGIRGAERLQATLGDKRYFTGIMTY
jgi:ABC-type glycerol-3-phosphate transport system substrate-binding protein